MAINARITDVDVTLPEEKIIDARITDVQVTLPPEVPGFEPLERLKELVDNNLFSAFIDFLSEPLFTFQTRGEEDGIIYFVVPFEFTPLSKIGNIAKAIKSKFGAQSLIKTAGKTALRKATPKQIEALLKGDNFGSVFEAMRKDPGSWARLAPSFSKETQALISATLKRQHPNAASRLFEEAILNAERSKVPISNAALNYLKNNKGGLMFKLISGAFGIMGIDLFTKWPLVDNLGFLKFLDWESVESQFNNGEITKEEALAEMDRIIELLEGALSLVEFSDNWNPLMIAFGEPFVITAKENLRTAQDVKDRIEGTDEPLPKGTLIINVSPSDSGVAVEGQFPSTGTFNKELEIGDYNVVVSKFGYISQGFITSIMEDETNERNIELDKEVKEVIPPEEQVGKLIISVIPENAIITVAGRSEITEAGTYELTPGSYGVKAQAEGFEPKTKNIFVRTDIDVEASFVLNPVFSPDIPTPEIPPILPKDAVITFTSNPTDADLYINGEYTFTTTPSTKLLSAGEYIFRVQKDGFFPTEMIAEVMEGETDTVDFTLTEIPETDVPRAPFIPFIPDVPRGLEPLFPPPLAPIFFEPTAPSEKKELLINIETTDLVPWKGRIYSIAFQDLSVPGSEAFVMTNDNEAELIRDFVLFFDAGNFDRLIGFKLSFDYRYIFNKIMLYRFQSKKWADIPLRDVKQLMDQVKESFVYFPDKKGTLNDYGKELLGKGKLGPQKDVLKMFLAKNFAYVEAFQKRQIEVSKGLYDLFRFSSQSGISVPNSNFPVNNPSKETNISNIPSTNPGEKTCKTCLQVNPLNNTECLVCGDNL